MRFKPWAKTDAPNPHTYSPDDLVESRRSKSPSVKIFKDFTARANYITQITKNKAFVPSSAAYNTDKGFKTMTRGLSRGYK